MTTQIQRRRGTTAQHGAFTGAVGEVTVDTDKEVLVVHDGAQVGGYPQMRENGSNSALALGSAGTPSLKFTGDTNTGIYSPGADQVAISTAGVQRLTIGSDGTLIGTSTTNLIARFTGPANGYTETTDGTGIARTQLISSVPHIGAASNHPLVLTTNNTERLRITSAGLVGVGTSAVTGINSQAEIAGGSATELKVSAGSANNANFRGVRFGIAGDNQDYSGVRFQPNSGELRTEVGFAGWGGFQTFYTNGLERLRITSAGNVGIGTTSPSNTLHIAKDNNHGITLERTGVNPGSVTLNVTSYGVCDLKANASIGIQSGGSDPIIFYTNGNYTERARIDSSGRLLVGMSSSTGGALLQVNGDRIRVGTAKTPASATDTGTAGEICWDASYIYVCTATNTWKRTAIATW